VRVALATAPVLLTESLGALLAGEVELIVVLDAGAEVIADVAVVTPGGPYVPAPVVVTLDDRPAARGGGVARFADGGPELPLQDLDAVLAFCRSGGRDIGRGALSGQR
jgi:hypothetical protein